MCICVYMCMYTVYIYIYVYTYIYIYIYTHTHILILIILTRIITLILIANIDNIHVNVPQTPRLCAHECLFTHTYWCNIVIQNVISSTYRRSST